MSGIVIAGGGLAGAAAAAALATQGEAVTLIERQSAPAHKICGEFLSADAQAYLARLGLAIPAGAPISRLRLIRGTRIIETALPFQGIGLSRRVLDEALLAHAARCGAQIVRGRAIRAFNPETLTLEVEGQGALRPKTLLLATGKHELRGAKRAISATPEMIGFKMHFRLAPAAAAALANHIELYFFQGGYAGLQCIEDGLANLCLLISRRHYAAWPALLAQLTAATPYLGRQLQSAQPQWPQPLAISGVPYGFLHRHRKTDPANLYRLGDQACVIHSFTGDGMAIALHSAALAAQSLRTNQTAQHYHTALRASLAPQMRWSNAFAHILQHKLAFTLARPGLLQQAARLTRVQHPITPK